MAVQIALLRAVNVGGQSVAMAGLRQLFVELGYPDARTLLQTGNVIFEAKASPKLGLSLEQALADRLGVRTDIILRSAKEWQTLIEANPFTAEADSAAKFLHVLPLKDKPAAGAIEDLRAAIKGPEIVELVSRDLYAFYPDGSGRSKLTIGLIEKMLGTRGTARNWNTVLKIGEAVKAS
jgi:uncharacterized protein (DUF1697 family)